MQRVARIVRAAGTQGSRPVVVTSAMSRVTDGLIDVVGRAAAGHVNGAQEVLDGLLGRHREVAEELLGKGARGEFDTVVHEAASSLSELLRVMSRHPGTRRALEDEIVAQGEHLSSRLLALALAEEGLPSIWVDARQVIRTDDRHGRASPLPDVIRAAAQELLAPRIEQGMIPNRPTRSCHRLPSGVTPAGSEVTWGPLDMPASSWRLSRVSVQAAPESRLWRPWRWSRAGRRLRRSCSPSRPCGGGGLGSLAPPRSSACGSPIP